MGTCVFLSGTKRQRREGNQSSSAEAENVELYLHPIYLLGEVPNSLRAGINLAL